MNRDVVGQHSVFDNVTLIAPLGLALLLVSCTALLVVDRKRALLPLFGMLFFVPVAQKIVVFTLDFNQMRIMVLIGLLRVVIRGELKNVKRHTIDYLVIGYALVAVLFHFIRDGGAVFVPDLGHFLDEIVPYIVFRTLIQTHEDLINAIKILFILTLIVSVFFTYEHFTGRNVFWIFGGVPEFTWIRSGRLRCQGAFAHPIIAGVYFATITPLFVSLWWSKYKTLAITGVIAALVIIYASASSTPIFALFGAILGALLFHLRAHMTVIRWSVYSLIVLLHMMMQAPVWNLIARVSATGGSTSWYRYMLINQTIHYFSNWWLIGVSNSTYFDWYVWPVDITNQFVGVALRTGLLGVVLFISTIALAFGAVGRMWRLAQQDLDKVVIPWALGCSLFALIMSFIGVSIWGQMLMLWPMILAMIASMDNYYRGSDSP